MINYKIKNFSVVFVIKIIMNLNLVNSIAPINFVIIVQKNEFKNLQVVQFADNKWIT